MTIREVRLGLIFSLLSLICFTYSNAQSSEVNGLFESDNVLKMKLVADFSQLQEERDKSSDYVDGMLIYDQGKEMELPVKVKVRGNFRLKEETCDFPPLKLKFTKSDIEETIFKNNRKLKLVTHCKDQSDMLNSVMREYLAYRIYNTISDLSLKVRLVEISYVDNADQSQIEKIGFLIEDSDDMCDRLSLNELNALNVSMEQLDKHEMIKMAMFQYMIGNKDWSVPKLHNVILVKEGSHMPPVGVPYDFDMSEFVNPPYRSKIVGPNEFENSYKGDRVGIDELQNEVEHFVEIKNEIINLILDMPEISVNCKQRCLKQVEDFYLKLESKSSLRRNFIAQKN